MSLMFWLTDVVGPFGTFQSAKTVESTHHFGVISMSIVNQVSQLYIGILGRAADRAGLEYWVQQVQTGKLTIEGVAKSFQEQPEWINGNGQLDRAGILNELYKNLFGREATGVDKAYWVLGEGASVPLEKLVLALIAPGAALGNDALVLAARTDAAVNFSFSDVDTTDLAAATAAIADVGSGVSFSLTTGVDTLVGTSGNDQFVSGNTTWNVGDSIDGGAGVDRLTIANENQDVTLAGRTLTSVEKLTILNVDPGSGAQDFNFANQMLDEVTVDFAGTENLSYVYLDNLRADTDLVVTNVVADGYEIYRNYDGVYSTLTGSVSQSNTFSNIDGTANDDYLYFENYAYFSQAAELNLTETWENIVNGGTTSTGSDDSYAYSYNYIDLVADNATVNVTYNLTDVVVPDGYSYIITYIDNESTAGKEDTVNVTYNLDNVDGLYAYVDTHNSGNDGEADTVTINANGVANTDGSNDFELDYFETLNINVTGDSDLGYVDVYVAAADQTINIAANADLTIGTLDEADDYKVVANISGSGDVTIGFNGDNKGLTVNAGTATGNLTLEVGSDATYATVVTAGSGDDKITLLNAFELNTDADAFLQVLDGGDGVDTFEIDAADLVNSQALLNADVTDFSDAIKNFERLSLTTFTTQVIDGTTLGFNDITIDGYTTGGSLTMEDQAKVTVTGDGTTDLAIVIDGAATGDQSVTLTLDAQGTTDATDDGLVLAALDVSDVEAISIVSNSADDDTEVADEVENDINVLDLDAAAATTITISGDSGLDLSGTLTDLETVDAADFDAGLTIDVSTAGQAVTITVGDGADDVTGSDYDDVISVGNGGNTVTGGLGLDTITLGSGATADDVDTVVFGAVADSQGVTVDVINGFQVNVQATTDTNSDDIVDATDIINDKIDLSAVVMGTATYAGEANGYGAVLTSLTGDATNSQAVLDTSTSTLYVDVNADGVLDSNDMAIQLTGVTDLSVDNFVF